LLRAYFGDTRNAVADDLWDLLHGRSLGIAGGSAMIVIGTAMVLLALNPGSSLAFSSEFPFVQIHRADQGTLIE
jgi:hypothetical protein